MCRRKKVDIQYHIGPLVAIFDFRSSSFVRYIRPVNLKPRNGLNFKKIEIQEISNHSMDLGFPFLTKKFKN